MDPMDKVRAGMKNVKIPGAHDIVYKDECMFCFDTPFSPGGVAVNLTTWQGAGEPYVALDHERTGATLYLLQKWTSVPKTDEEIETEAEVTRAAAAAGSIVIPTTKNRVEKKHTLLIMPDRVELPYPNPDLPMIVSQACDAVIAHTGNRVQEGAAAFVEEFEAKESKYARDLVQLPADGKKIPSDSKLWKCDETGVTENLWLNLSTGFIGSGRKHWDGSGGNGAAERHWEATGKQYPLVVKLGTITPHGADVFSYAADENDMVTDPLLAEHLAHWGIDIMMLEKTEKTMAELQVTLNLEHDWAKVTEEGDELEIVSGPGLVGIANLGNTCYINSVVQCLFAMPEICVRYPEARDGIFRSAPQNPANDFPTQMAKLGAGLLTDRYATTPAGEGPTDDDEVCVRPSAFKALVGRGHPEFSTGRQQDASEYLQHLIEFASRAERTAGDRLPADGTPTANLFAAAFEERIECVESGTVRYKPTSGSAVVQLTIPMEAALNGREYKEYQDRKRAKTTPDGDAPAPVVARVPFEACLERLVGDAFVPDFDSPATGKKGPAKKTMRFRAFPRYLVLVMNRYQYGENWEQIKMEVEVTVPEALDLEPYRAMGLQPSEAVMPDDPAPAAAGGSAPAAPLDMAMVEQLMSMGFSENGCKRAVKAAGQGGAEAASEWIFAHMEDPDFNDPIVEEAAGGGGGGGGAAQADPEAIAMLTMLGFTETQAKAALGATGGNSERAADWLFSRSDNLDAAVAEALAAQSGAAAAPAAGGGGVEVAGPADDGLGRYSLFGIVSHLGKNTGSGHYVAHVKKDGRWVIFNDRKVGLSKKPPLDVGYMYFFRRDE